MITKVIKRDGRQASYNIEKIANAIYKALEVSAEFNEQDAGQSRHTLSMDLAGRVPNISTSRLTRFRISKRSRTWLSVS